jgi:rubrerythrin
MAQLAEKIIDYMSSVGIDRAALINKLSEFLAVEKGGVKLYDAALSCVQDAEIKKKFKEFHKQTIRHVEIVTGIIHKLGGNPSFMSREARLAEQKAEALLATMKRGVRSPMDEINAVENIVIAETKDHADWELLGKIARQTDDRKLAAILRPAVSEVEAQEDEHLNWSKSTMADLAMRVLNQKAKAPRPEKLAHDGNGRRAMTNAMPKMRRKSRSNKSRNGSTRSKSRR